MKNIFHRIKHTLKVIGACSRNRTNLLFAKREYFCFNNYKPNSFKLILISKCNTIQLFDFEEQNIV